MLFSLKKAKISPALKKEVLGALKTFLVFLILSFVVYHLVFWGRIFPNTYVAGYYVGGLRKEAVANALLVIDPPKKVILANSQTFEIDLSGVDFSYDFEETAEAVYRLGRSGNLILDLVTRLHRIFQKHEIGLRVLLDETKLTESILVIAGEVSKEPVYPSATSVSGRIVVSKGEKGRLLDKKALRAEIGRSLSFLDQNPIPLVLKEVDPTLSDEEVVLYQARAQNLVDKTLKLTFEDQEFVLVNDSLFSLLDPRGGYLNEKTDLLIEDVAKSIERGPREPIFQIENGRVVNFSPSKEGVAINRENLKTKIFGNFRSLEESDEKTIDLIIPVEKTPTKTKTEDVNDLGIVELLGVGKSRFSGSIASRVHNIGVASKNFNGVLIPPGETFSFNATLGDVSAYTGYQKAYIIKDGKTVLGDGGGVCQVSTTFFRAALETGLPIIERRAHSYRVGYYEQDALPGLDATVYSPTTDLKVLNNTPGYILIQTKFDPKAATLSFEFYGTKDGRVATISKPVVSDVTPPPEDLYVDDPSLPLGSSKQIEYKAWGAKSRFDYRVTRDNEVLFEKTFFSSYQPWQAIFLKGIGPIN